MTDVETNKKSKDQELFDRISSNYASKDLYPPSQLPRRLRLIQTVKNIPYLSNSDILEVGCGAGFSSQYLSGLFRNYSGIDYSGELIRYAKNYAIDKTDEIHISFEQIDFYNMPTDKKYDVIFMVGVLHHMENLQDAIEHAYQLLKPGGYFIANEPQSSNFFIQILRKIRGVIDSSYSSEQIQLSEQELSVAFQQSGFDNINVFAQGYFSTPFAEVKLKPTWLFKPASFLSCEFDKAIESTFLNKVLKKLAWNIVITGKKL